MPDRSAGTVHAAGAAATHRLFIALWPDAQALAALQAARDQHAWPATARPQGADRLHLTLLFLGAVPAARLPALQAALADLPWQPFTLAFGRLALWHGGTAVLVPHAVPPELTALHGALQRAVGDLGLTLEERPFQPHVTLARAAQGVRLDAAVTPWQWHAGGFVLVESARGRYTPLPLPSRPDA